APPGASARSAFASPWAPRDRASRRCCSSKACCSRCRARSSASRSRPGRPTRCAPCRSSARSRSGFRPSSTSSAAGLRRPSAARDFTRRLLGRLRALPAVEGAAIASAVPLDIHGLPLRTIEVEGRTHSDAAPDRALTNTVTPGYFRTMAIPFVGGGDFVDLDDTAAPPQAIVNEEFVRRFIGDGETIGRRVSSRGASYTIAGIVRNSVSEAFGEPPTPVIYLSYRDRPAARGEIHVRTRAGAETLVA